jgi:hypothetical protein
MTKFSTTKKVKLELWISTDEKGKESELFKYPIRQCLSPHYDKLL